MNGKPRTIADHDLMILVGGKGGSGTTDTADETGGMRSDPSGMATA